MTSVRRAIAEDAHQMTLLVRDSYAPHADRIGRLPAPMEADYAIVVTDCEAWVTEDGSGVTGLLVLKPQAKYMLLDNIAVRVDRQGKGLGACLLAWAENRARDLGLDEVRLYTNVMMTDNIAYYESHGYVKTHLAVADGFARAYFTRRLDD